MPKKYTRYEMVSIWQAIDLDLHNYTAMNALCGPCDEAFDILTEAASVSTCWDLDELCRDILNCHMGPSTIIHVYDIADGNIMRFIQFVGEMYDGYSRCYGWRWQMS